MTEKSTDWKVKAVINRKAITEDIAKLVKIRVAGKKECIISATSEAEAIKKAEVFLERNFGILTVHVKAMYARKLPT